MLRAGFVVLGLGLPAQRAGPCIERDYEAIRRGEIDHVRKDAERTVPARVADVLDDVRGQLAAVLPKQVSVGGIKCLNDAPEILYQLM